MEQKKAVWNKNNKTDLLSIVSVADQVSWIRHRDTSLLAVNKFVYTSSHRVKVCFEIIKSDDSRAARLGNFFFRLKHFRKENEGHISKFYKNIKIFRKYIEIFETLAYLEIYWLQVQNNPESSLWRLVLQPVVSSDAGWYSCQVSTTPHLQHRMFLGVIQPKTTILGPKERYIEKGSTINLTCIIQAGPLNLNPSFVFWNYNGKIITYDRERGGTVVISDR